jgi:hypothetical protein
MNAHSARYPRRVAILAVCREALRIGPLELDGQGWRFGRRRFNYATVARLIALGEAIRIGDIVRAIA